MSTILTEVFFIVLLLLANGVFAMTEIAVVSSRKTRIKKLADEGSPRAKAALALVEDPTRFLSTVQIGITLIGTLAGAIGGTRLADKLALWLVDNYPALGAYAEWISISLVVGAISYLSLIIGELVPKRIGLNNPESKAIAMAAPMRALSRLALPFVWLLTVSTNAVLKLFGLGAEKEEPPSEEEISHLIEQGTTAGVFHKAEQAMVEGVLRLDEKLVTEIMTRRGKIVWLDVNDADEANWRKIVSSGHSLFPVFEGTRDHVLGMVAVKALWANSAIGLKNNLRDHITQPLYVPHTINAVQLLETFKKSGKHLALVTDEFGSIEGIVTLIDVMEAIVGDLPEPGDRRIPGALQREDGSWLVDGAMDIEEFKRLFKIAALPGEDDDDFKTVGGFLMDRLGHIPVESESVVAAGFKFEVVDMDRHRVDKVLLSKDGAKS
jgi:putative hemolysin